ncbi:hypothetical protein BDZ97DRAFT_1208119 [Flammula alnicola]|nr:hypothetical protein BDZ97DRAFT_1208119 [Flammula alnicola]
MFLKLATIAGILCLCATNAIAQLLSGIYTITSVSQHTYVGPFLGTLSLAVGPSAPSNGRLGQFNLTCVDSGMELFTISNIGTSSYVGTPDASEGTFVGITKVSSRVTKFRISQVDPILGSYRIIDPNTGLLWTVNKTQAVGRCLDTFPIILEPRLGTSDYQLFTFPPVRA